jgi:hypothetical protein
MRDFKRNEEMGPTSDRWDPTVNEQAVMLYAYITSSSYFVFYFPLSITE